MEREPVLFVDTTCDDCKDKKLCLKFVTRSPDGLHVCPDCIVKERDAKITRQEET